MFLIFLFLIEFVVTLLPVPLHIAFHLPPGVASDRNPNTVNLIGMPIFCQEKNSK